eukprot:Seg373.7 transcript_id=Seg373.7/GoldUCD/mRNA.D3Y31 product="hypothetical protein" protein_id=Seg373.7/GoldUCD/D3Y31
MVKTQVAPLRVTTIPRLELQSCFMAMKLIQFIEKQLDLPSVKISFWTDSSVALAGIKSESRTLKQFMANRVASGQESTKISQWHHVPGNENPAGMLLLERGINLCELDDCDNTCFSDPDFLKRSEDLWSRSIEDKNHTAVATEQRKVVQAVEVATLNEVLDIGSFSSLKKLRNVTAYVRRPFRQWKQRKWGEESVANQAVSVEELQEAEEWLIKHDQKKCYQRELQDLSNKKPLSKNSSVYNLNPFIDEDGLIRVGGRLRRASLEYASQQQIILPKRSHITELIIRETSEKEKNILVQIMF